MDRNRTSTRAGLPRWARVRALLASAGAAALSACALTAPPAPPLDVYAARPAPSFHVTLVDFEGRQELAGASVVVPKPAQPRVPASLVEARVSAKDGAADALTMHWREAWYASLRVDGGTMDLRPYVADGTLEFDLDVVDMARGGLSFAMSCGKDCGRIVRWVLPSRALAGKGWQHVAFAMRCFVRDGDDFSAVTQPFAMESSGSGEAAVANVRFVAHGRPSAQCPDYRTESVTPAPLEQVWALDWWMPRHQKKLDEIAALRARHVEPGVVFIGDSITHGWEDGGLAVWNEHFAKYDALDLGFGGDHTENVLWRLQHGELDGIHPKVVTLMIGTNNTGDRMEDPKTTAAGIRRLLDEIRRRQPDARVLLLAIFPRDEKPDSPLRRLNDRVNAIIAGYADDSHVFFLDINRSLTNADGTLSTDVMPDLLHPSARGYAIWAERIDPVLQDLVQR